MLARLPTLWERLQTSLWFTPAAMALGAVGLAWAALVFDAGAFEEPVWWLHAGDAADASDLLSNLLASLITMATLAISITVVVLTLAAGHLGPRLIRMFVSDRRTQLSLGTLTASIVYLLLVLRSLRDDMADAYGGRSTRRKPFSGV